MYIHTCELGPIAVAAGTSVRGSLSEIACIVFGSTPQAISSDVVPYIRGLYGTWNGMGIRECPQMELGANTRVLFGTVQGRSNLSEKLAVRKEWDENT